jgi:hypothetical protein
LTARPGETVNVQQAILEVFLEVEHTKTWYNELYRRTVNSLDLSGYKLSKRMFEKNFRTLCDAGLIAQAGTEKNKKMYELVRSAVNEAYIRFQRDVDAMVEHRVRAADTLADERECGRLSAEKFAGEVQLLVSNLDAFFTLAARYSHTYPKLRMLFFGMADGAVRTLSERYHDLVVRTSALAAITEKRAADIVSKDRQTITQKIAARETGRDQSHETRFEQNLSRPASHAEAPKKQPEPPRIVAAPGIETSREPKSPKSKRAPVTGRKVAPAHFAPAASRPRHTPRSAYLLFAGIWAAMVATTGALGLEAIYDRPTYAAVLLAGLIAALAVSIALLKYPERL